jgi:thiol-disulfide isomerase/thioredoxin
MEKGESNPAKSRVWTRRGVVLAAGFTLASAPSFRKPRAADNLPRVVDRLERHPRPVTPPEAFFQDGQGTRLTLETYRGQGLVVNFWATWCAPCVVEMPALNALNKTLEPYRIAVLPLSSDRGGAPLITRWYGERGLTALPVLLDPGGAMARAWGLRGLPVTAILDRAGREVARLTGPGDWAAADIPDLLRGLIND